MKIKNNLKEVKKMTYNKGKSKKTQPLYAIYGAKESKNGQRVNITLIANDGENRQFATVSIKKKGGSVKVKMTDEAFILDIPRLDISDEKYDKQHDYSN